jgi:hypothetical protein
VEIPNDLPIHSLNELRCTCTFFFICGKSDTRLLIWEEKNQMTNPSTMINRKIDRKMERPSGALRLRSFRYTGSKMMERKKAMTNGVMIFCAIKMMVPRKYSPINSMARLTVNGKLLITKGGLVLQSTNKTKPAADRISTPGA